MPGRERAAFFLVIAGAFALAGCQRTQTADPPVAQTAASRGTPPAASTTANPLEEHSVTSRYRIDIGYPPLEHDEAPLAAMLRRIAGAAKRDFLRSLPDPKLFPEFADRQLQLRMEFTLAARTGAFASVREKGFQDTGGAHPARIDAAIVYDAHARRTVTLDDLFADQESARKALADFARTEIMKTLLAQAPKPGAGSQQAIAEWKDNAKQMIEQGTQPTSQNFANFIVRTTGNPLDPSPGLTLIFPPYQVAAYVYGTQTVFVPTEVFARYLKPQYRNAFGIPIVN
ncbi:MAG TPA: RsiV family protein [Rhodanobacteraceae bacterium]